MTARLYTDVNVDGALINALRARGIDVLTAHEDGTRCVQDDGVLSRATELGRPLLTGDKHYLRIAALRQREQVHFSAVLFYQQQTTTLAALLEDVELVLVASAPHELVDRVYRLPLR